MFVVIQHFYYLLFHLIVVCSLLLGKYFYKPMRFPSLVQYKRTLFIPVLFIIWDALVTNRWWYFSQRYTTVRIGSLPLEEILFFFTVSYALLTLTENLKVITPTPTQHSLPKKCTLVYRVCQLFLIAFGSLALNKGWEYTTFISFLTVIIVRPSYWHNHIYKMGFIFTVITTLIFNFYLTVLPIVTYNSFYKSSITIGTIPIEDFLYGILFYTLIFQFYYEKKPRFSF